jgi:hypothetical protein
MACASRVTSIRGEFEEDVVTDEDFRLAIEAQENALRAQGIQRKVLDMLQARLLAGARVSTRRWYFDSELGIVVKS